VILADPRTYEDLKNYRIQLSIELSLYLDHPKGNKEIEDLKIITSSPIDYCRFGSFDDE
jgi:hypothetical protein